MLKQVSTDLVIIGGGPAGLAAAIKARQAGIEDMMIIERDRELGGILQQCIHNGFGLHRFQDELSGPEYAQRLIDEVEKLGIPTKLDTMVLNVTPEKKVTAINSQEGMLEISAKAIILAMGCRERTRGAINIPGARPAGVYTAGTAQRFVNMEGYLPGKRVVILGSGDIGLIMARRMTLEGAKVEAVVELMPYSNGLTRNIVQCLEDYGIPLYLGHTVVDIQGKERVEGITVAKVDEKLKPIRGTDFHIPCDTLLLSVGLIPENELSQKAEVEMDRITGGPVVSAERETSIEGIFACGNVLHVHDLADYASVEGEIAGLGAARYIQKASPKDHKYLSIKPGNFIRYAVPQKINLKEMPGQITLYMRVTEPMDKGRVKVIGNGEILLEKTERYLKPAEMLAIDLDTELVTQLGSVKELIVEIVKEEIKAKEGEE